MNPHSFRGKIRRAPAFTDELRLNGRWRTFDVFLWEDRLAAHEAANDFWWATLDTYIGEDPQEFWRECVETERVGRTFSAQIMFAPLSKSNGARLLWPLSWYDLIIARDNSGLARLEGTPHWHAFSGLQPTKLSKPGASRPTIWASQFNLNYGYSAVKGLHAAFTEQQAARLSPFGQAYWREGVNSRPLRLVVAAMELLWKPQSASVGPLSIERFWRLLIKSRIGQSAALPPSLLESPEFSASGSLNWRRSIFAHSPAKTTLLFTWEQHDISLTVEFPLVLDSTHERLEAHLELRNWLSGFFPLPQVESWFETS